MTCRLTNSTPLEHGNIRVFNVHPGMAKSSVLRKELEIYANDTRTFGKFSSIPQEMKLTRPTAELFGSLTVYLAGRQADFLRGSFIAANWDVEDLESHRVDIVEQGLLKGQAFKGTIGPGGHQFQAD